MIDRSDEKALRIEFAALLVAHVAVLILALFWTFS